MYGRIIVLTLKESTESSKLKEFANDIIHQSAYDVIVIRMKESPGFIYKTHTVLDTAKEQKIISHLVFDNETNFLEYSNAIENVSVWEILQDYADTAGLKLEYNDGEVNEQILIQHYISNL